MMRRIRGSAVGVAVCALLSGLLPTVVVGAGEAGSGAPAQQSRPAPLDEVLVVGEKLDQMQRRIVDIEDHFNAVYNTLNTRHEFDVHCVSEAPTMSNIRRRLCKPVYVANAEREQSIAFLQGQSAPQADLVTEMHRDEYRRNMLEVVKRSPQLQQLLRERAELAAHYRKATQDRFKGHAILFNE
jgi:hypothetical protein